MLISTLCGSLLNVDKCVFGGRISQFSALLAMATQTTTWLCLLVLATFLGLSTAFIDECSQFQTCDTCLNLTSSSNGRANCGWCHVPIMYSDGTQGARCADIRDKPWKCPEMYETYYCTAGFVCDFGNGTCSKSPTPGEGFGNITDCQQHCFKTPDTYLCNTTSYECQKCTFGDPRCADKSQACQNCRQPPGLFKCVKSANETGECTFCTGSDTNCTDFKTACTDCSSPKPPPPPPPPPPPQKQYTCNNQTLQCEEAKSGMVIQACSAQCSNSTPSNIVGVWRGIEAQAGFILGEWDYNFSASSVTIRDPMGTITHGSVATIGSMVITLLDGPNAGSKISVLTTEMSYGPETLTVGFALSGFNKPVPQSITEAFDGQDGARVHVLSRCHAWKTSSCDFSSVFKNTKAMIPEMYRNYANLPGWLDGASAVFRANPHIQKPIAVMRRGVPNIQHDPDPCNQFRTCSSCIGQHEGQFQCGWCMGSTIFYNDTGDSGLKCAGFIQGQPLPFSCSIDFRTEDCSGYSCNYSTPQPQCQVTPDGTFSSQAQCENTCKAAQFARCNQQTQTCDPCAQGEPDCQFTKDECEQSCALQYQRCNYTTHQCESCSRLTDPNCTQSAGECSYNCQHDTHGVCDPTSGKCTSCDPTKGTPGCAAQCNATCSRSLNFQCDNATLTCIPGQGNMTLKDCASSCSNQSKTDYGCDWSNSTNPQCKEGMGSQSLQDCAQDCHAVQFAKCNPVTGQCESCQQGTPGCSYTVDYCTASCQKSNLLGVWRGIQINKNFTITEFEFTFYPDGQVAFRSTQNLSAIYQAQFTEAGTSAEGRPIIFVIKYAPEGGPLPLQATNNIRGLFTVQDGEEGVTRFLNLALGFNLRPASTFDDGMTKLEFVLVSCKGTGHCDFTAGKVPEQS
eukprot:m.87928 g.87928  ORF g.87928 m.87928 type:complete len:904 (+) comp13602_c1_seq1:1215-3926(+)